MRHQRVRDAEYLQGVLKSLPLHCNQCPFFFSNARHSRPPKDFGHAFRRVDDFLQCNFMSLTTAGLEESLH